MARGNGIELALTVDERDAVKGVKKVGDALEDLQDETKDLGKEGDRAQASLEDNFRAIAKAVKAAEDAAEKIGPAMKSGVKDAGRATGEFKDEAKQNFGEVASSFTGDMSSAADLVQGTLGGLAASMSGPIGLALGAASIALGAFIADAQKQAEKAEDLRLKALEAVKSATEQGVSTEEFLTGVDQIVARLQELEELKTTDARWFWEEDPSQLEEWTDALNEMGRPASEVSDVLEASTPIVKRYMRALEDSRDALDAEREALEKKQQLNPTQDTLDQLRALDDEIAARDEVIGHVKDEIKIRDEAADSQKRQSDAGLDAALAQAKAEEDLAAATEETAQRRIDAQQAVADSVAQAYLGMVEDATAFATTEEGALDINRWLTYIQEHAGAIATYKANLQLLKLSPEDWNALLALPEETRTQWVAQVTALPEAARQPFIDGLDGVLGNAGSSATVAFDDNFAPDTDVTITTKADTKAATKDITKVADAPYTATIKAKADLGTAARDLAAILTTRTVTFKAAADTSGAQVTLDTFVRRNTGRVIQMYARVATPSGVNWQ